MDVLDCTSSCAVIVGGADAKQITVCAVRTRAGEGTGPSWKKAGCSGRVLEVMVAILKARD